LLVKLVFVNRFFYPDISATSQLLTDVTLFLAVRGHDVHVVTSRLFYDGTEKLMREEKVGGVHVHRIWTTSFGRTKLIGRAFDYLSFYSSVFFVVLKLLQEGDRVVVKTDPPLLSVPVGWAVRLKGAELYNWLQDLFAEVALALDDKIPRLVAVLLKWLRDDSLLSTKMNRSCAVRKRR
jgi:colanic acid biosynthesis glycosyl transferase WcaI